MSWTLIESQTLSGSAASVTLGTGGTIPQTYKSLRILLSVRTDAANIAGGFQVRLNGSTTSGIMRDLQGNGTSALSYSSGATEIGNNQGNSATANTFGSIEIRIPNYAGSTYKAFDGDTVSENNATTAYVDLSAALWSNTSPVTYITFANNSGSFIAGCTFTLYGLK